MKTYFRNVNERWSFEVISRSMRRSAGELLSLWSMGLGGLALLVVAFGLL